MVDMLYMQDTCRRLSTVVINLPAAPQEDPTGVTIFTSMRTATAVIVARCDAAVIVAQNPATASHLATLAMATATVAVKHAMLAA